MAFTTGNITLYMGPTDVGAPDDLEQTIVDFMDDAVISLDIAVQELGSVPITHAIVRAKQRGVRVRVVTENDYAKNETPSDDPFTPVDTTLPPGGFLRGDARKEQNRHNMAALNRVLCEVRTDLNDHIFHQKFVVRDKEKEEKRRGEPTKRKGKRALLTGSTNFTATGTHKNLNHLVEIKSARVLKQYVDEFDEIWNGTFGTARLRHDPAPGDYMVSGVPVRPLFAPDHAPEMEIMKQMLKARKSIDFAIFTFSNSSGIDDALFSLIRGGIAVRGVFEWKMARTWSPLRPLNALGADVHVAPKEKHGPVGKVHHKLMVIDEQVIIVGSFNYTGPANRLNDENILVIGDLDMKKPKKPTPSEQQADGQALAKYQKKLDNYKASIAAQKKLAKYALDEIKRIISTHSITADQFIHIVDG